MYKYLTDKGGHVMHDYKDKLKKVIFVVAVAMSLFHIYTASFGSMEAMLQRSIHLTFALPLAFLIYPASKKSKSITIIDIMLAVLSIVPGLYIYLDYGRISTRWPFAHEVTNWDFIIGILLVMLLTEVARRIMGNVMVIIIGAFLAYGFLGQYIPGMLGHRGFQPKRIIEYLFLTTDGIFGTPLGTSATYVVLFVLFGSFLSLSGSGKYFMDLAVALTGRQRGGPAKIAVISSALFGTISGAAVANVYATGTFTIPLMKKIGYRPQFAGAVEAVASTGGQIMPPVMGSAAFIMADMLGLPYLAIAKAALLPAILYFLSVYVMVDIESIKTGLRGLNDDEIPDMKDILKKSYLLIPPIFIVLILCLGFTASKAALYSTFVALIVGLINKEKKIGIKEVFEALEDGAKGSVMVAVTTGAAGIIVGIATQTGLGFKFTNIVTSLSQGNAWIAGVLVMVACLILGMGLPTVAAFIMVAALAAPALIEIGISPLSAQMFVFYYCCISTITPPVALSAYAGASIAGSDPFKTGFTAVRLGFVAFIVPFMFLTSNELLLDGTLMNVLLSMFTAIIGAIILGCGVQGWLVTKCNVIERILLLTAALLTIKPGLTTDLIGLAVFGAIYLIQKFKAKKVNVEAQA